MPSRACRLLSASPSLHLPVTCGFPSFSCFWWWNAFLCKLPPPLAHYGHTIPELSFLRLLSIMKQHPFLSTTSRSSELNGPYFTPQFFSRWQRLTSKPRRQTYSSLLLFHEIICNVSVASFPTEKLFRTSLSHVPTLVTSEPPSYAG
jgi:hypothetical protein